MTFEHWFVVYFYSSTCLSIVKMGQKVFIYRDLK